jgi:DNA mismatch repair protein MutL
VLSDELSNQIAAGEVVERPVSAVKELVENALDAGARRVFVDLVDGGRTRLRVVDDGCGMTREDAVLALKRHATSKIRTAEDLAAIRSLGFRGEALPSIASVSRFELITRPADEDVGTSVRVEPGGIVTVRDVGCPPGTTVDVQQLFCNVPARLKFLRTAATELGHVSQLVDSFALGHHSVHFRLTNGGRVVSDYPSDRDVRARIHAVLGADVVGRLHEVYLDADICVSGYVAEPGLSHPGTQDMYLFVNGRQVKDKLLYRAIGQAYGALLDRGRYPTAVLYLDVAPDDVDVNVHPTKAEVRFVRSGAVFGDISRAIQLTLAATPWAGKPLVSAQRDIDSLNEPDASGAPALAEGLAQGGGSSYAPTSGPARSAAPPEPRLGSPGRAPRPSSAPDVRFGLRFVDSPPPSLFDTPAPEESRAASVPGSVEPASAPEVSPSDSPKEVPAPAAPRGAPHPGDGQYFSRLQYVGQVRRTYLVCQTEGGLVVIDQHAADERYHYERLKRQFAEKRLLPQPLLFSELVEVDAGRLRALAEFGQQLRDMGFEIEPMGGKTIAIRAIPELLIGRDYTQTVLDVLGELAEGGQARALDDRVTRIFATLACHTAVRAGDTLTGEEVRALFRKMDETPYSAHCPHGRPVLAVVPFAEMERWFHRT